MKIVYLFLIVFISSSCKQRFYRAAARSIEETIMLGQNFAVTITDEFERNDIVEFDYFGPDYNSPDEEAGGYKMHWEKRVYRLVAYSGDSLEIKAGEVFVNSRHIPLPPKAKVEYEVFSKGQIEEFYTQDSYEATITKTGDTIRYVARLTAKQAFDYLQRKPFIISVKRTLPDMPYINDTSYARASSAGKWKNDNYGPLKIPLPGDIVFVDRSNFKFYKNIPGIKKGNDTIKEKFISSLAITAMALKIHVL